MEFEKKNGKLKLNERDLKILPKEKCIKSKVCIYMYIFNFKAVYGVVEEIGLETNRNTR